MPIQPGLQPVHALASLVGIVAVLFVHATLALRAGADLRQHEGQVRIYTAGVWQVLIALVAVAGPLAYFAFGRVDG